MGPHLRALLTLLRPSAPVPEPSDEPVSFLTLEHGTPVVDRFGEPIGHVERVLTIKEICHFDGIVVSTPKGSRFVDAPEVRRIGRTAVHLSITGDDVETGGTRDRSGLQGTRIGRTEATDDDRQEVMDRLKDAYVADVLDAHDLADRIERCYDATTLDELDALVPDDDAD